MKKSLVVLVLVAMVVVLFSGPARAEKPKFFGENKAACESALSSGEFTAYEAKFFGLKGKDPANGTTKIVAPLEANACTHMLTTAGMQWVVQLDNTPLRWNANADGSLGQVYARDDCGNPIDGISYGPPAAAPAAPPKPAATAPVTPATVSQTQTVTTPETKIVFVSMPATAAATEPPSEWAAWGRHMIHDMLNPPAPIEGGYYEVVTTNYSNYQSTGDRHRTGGFHRRHDDYSRSGPSGPYDNYQRRGGRPPGVNTH